MKKYLVLLAATGVILTGAMWAQTAPKPSDAAVAVSAAGSSVPSPCEVLESSPRSRGEVRWGAERSCKAG